MGGLSSEVPKISADDSWGKEGLAIDIVDRENGWSKFRDNGTRLTNSDWGG